MKNFFAIMIIISMSAFSQTGIFVPELKHFDSTMMEILSNYNIPGGQLAITYQGRLVYSRGFGYADTSLKSLVQPNSIFRLASVSKSITSISIMYLFEKGLLDLDAKVFGAEGILNDSMYDTAMDERIYKITVRQLLNHSSGFKFDFSSEPLWKTYDIAKEFGVVAPTDSFELVLKWTLLNKSLGFIPGTSVAYSNFGYTILGLVIEKITGQNYMDFVRNTILLPLGITEIYAGRTLSDNKYKNEVTYYDYTGAPLSTSIYTGIPNSVPAQYGGYNWEIMTPCGGWVASAQDLCKLLTAVDRYPTRPDILSSTTIDTMTTKSLHWPDYALGWFVNNDGYWHTGGIQGSATVIQCNTPYQLNYAILFNSLPEIYTPFYDDFMNLVTEDFSKIESWPKHDLFTNNSAMDSEKNVFNKSLIEGSLLISPNPASEAIEISAPSNINGELVASKVKIYNHLGECVSDSISLPQGQGLKFDVSNLSAGLYFLRIGDITMKFIKI